MAASITVRTETLCSKETGQCFDLAAEVASTLRQRDCRSEDDCWIDKARRGEVRSPQGLRIAAHMMFWPGLVQLGTSIGLYKYNLETNDSEHLHDLKAMWFTNIALGGFHVLTGFICAIVYDSRKYLLIYPSGKPTKSLSFNGPLVQPPIKNNPGFIGVSATF